MLKIDTLFICFSPWFYTLVLLLWKRWHNSFVSQGDSWYPDKSNFDIKYFSPGGSKSKSDKSMWSLASPLVDKYWLLINWVGVTPNLSNFNIQYLSLRSSKLKPEKRLWPLGRPSLVNTYCILISQNFQSNISAQGGPNWKLLIISCAATLYSVLLVRCPSAVRSSHFFSKSNESESYRY